MELVLDASALMCIILNEPEKGQIVALTKNAEIVSPDVISFEVGNALSRMVKKHKINEEQVLKAYSLFETIPMRIVKTDVHKALIISCKYNLYAYDAYYLETAQRLALPLLTLDGSMKDRAKLMNIDLLEVT
jgi:predicted nucleic acid-binding protein